MFLVQRASNWWFGDSKNTDKILPRINDDKSTTEGGKTYGLRKLIEGGFHVPRFAYVTTSFSKNDIASVLRSKFNGDYRKLFAVRSSAANEDSTTKSNAGAFHTELGVPYDKVYDAALKVKASYGDQEGTIIIQEFIPSNKAGVMFTNAGENITVISSNFGLCKTVVDGEDCDVFYILPENGEIIKKKISKKVPIYFKDHKFVQAEETDEQCLTNDDIKLLVEKGKQIQEYFGKPQDVEWCIWNDKLYLLQSRPITKKIIDKIVYYDGANIQESFPGIVLPLTFTATNYAYKWIYYNALLKAGVPKIELDNHLDIFENMLYLEWGRMFYNMDNWKGVRNFIPSFKKKNDDFEAMITNKMGEYHYRTNNDIVPVSWWKFIPRLIYNYIYLQSEMNQLITDANKTLREFNLEGADAFTYENCISSIKSYNELFLSRWNLIGINDMFTAMFYNYLLKKFGADNIQHVVKFNTVSTKQLDGLAKLAKSIKKYDDIWNSIEIENKQIFDDLLKKYDDVAKVFKEYNNTYGGRFGNELKLETLDLMDDFSKFCKLMKLYSDYKPSEKTESHNETIKLSEGLPFQGLSSLDKLIRRWFNMHATNRENLRLVRSNFFGATRKIFTRIGQLLHINEIIDDSRDVFYLTFDEIMNKEHIDDYIKMQEIVRMRKDDYKRYQELDPPEYFVTINGATPNIETQNIITNTNMFKALGASPGKITGKVKLFENPDIPNDDFDILVAKNTDPGWVPLIGKCKAMIIESGGILSHAAIVSRELEKPAVIGIHGAMKILKDGQTVEVDGSKGIVTIINT